MTLLLSMIDTFILSHVNHVLAQEPWAQQQIQAHAGQVVAFTWGAGRFGRLYVACGATGMLSAVPQADLATLIPDATLTFAPDLLAHIAQHGMAAAAQKVQVSGDAELVGMVSYLLQHLRWDIEHDLSRVLGDIPAHHLVQTARQIGAQLQQSGQRLTENVVEYLTEENPLLVTASLLADHRAALQVLRDQVARLEKRVAKIA